MKKIVFLIIAVSIISVSCARKPEKPQIDMESEMVMPEAGSTAETQPFTTQPAAVSEAAKDALAPQVPVAAVVVPEKPAAEDIQKALKNAGLYTGDIDGKIGPKSKKAIEEFQAQNGLNADGVVGPKTWEKLKSYLTKME